MSMIPSWNPTILPAVTTAIPFNAYVFPEPTVSTFEIIPGNTPPFPSTFTLGSITSFTGVILTDSPGFAISKVTVLICSSSNATAFTAPLSTYRIPSSIFDVSANWISLM